ncbi:hypothetical protein ACFL0Z_01500 [Patescibacteria group bacterium]
MVHLAGKIVFAGCSLTKNKDDPDDKDMDEGKDNEENIEEREILKYAVRE